MVLANPNHMCCGICMHTLTFIGAEYCKSSSTNTYVNDKSRKDLHDRYGEEGAEGDQHEGKDEAEGHDLCVVR